MRLLIDVGNTEITLGLATGAEVRGRWRLTSSAERTPDEWATTIENFIVRAGHSPAEIGAACMASVVPLVTGAIREALLSGITNSVGMVNAAAGLPIMLDVEEPNAVGADRIANVLAALERHPGDSIVVDLGTATTYDCVTADRRFIGGSIAPGLRTSADHLVRRAAQLTEIALTPPTRAIGKRTDEHIRAGVLFGTADAIDGMVRRIRAEWPTSTEPKVVATGGLSPLIAPLTSTVDTVDLDLTLHGLRIAADSLGLAD